MTVVLKVRDVMSKNVTKVSEDATVLEAAKKMVEKGVKCAIVIGSNDEALGVVTEGSITRKVLAAGRDASAVKVKEIMSSPVLTIPADASIREASEQLLTKGVKQLYVEDDGEIVGLVTEHLILKAVTEVVLTLISI